MSSQTVAISLEAGRSAFGGDAQAYHDARPPYPEALFDRLDALVPIMGATLFEVGPGTGLATARMLERRPMRYLAIEPDARLGAFLAEQCAQAMPPLEILTAPFEEAELPPASFDLGIAATSFHWLPQAPALARVFAALRPGGLWAMWWNIYATPGQRDPLQEATAHLYGALPQTPSRGGPDGSMILDRAARLASLAAAGFVETGDELLHWPIRMDARQVRALAATYSGVTLAEASAREALLDGVERTVNERFGGSIERSFATALYWGRKPAR